MNSTVLSATREFGAGRVFMLAACAGSLWLLAEMPALAQQYPVKPLRFVVPYAAGGGGDIVARIVAQKLTASLGQQVIIENRLGAGGNIGAAFVAKSVPDGYTLLLITNTHASNMSLYSKVDYDLVRDFAPVSLMSSVPLILVVHPTLPVRSVKDLIALAKTRPGQLIYSSGGNGSTPHIAAALFSSMGGIKLMHIPYRGNSEATTDLISGQVQLMFSSMSAVLPQVKSGRLRPLAMTGSRRVAAAPELPTVAESGIPGYVVDNWTGMVAPAGTPRDIVGRLNSELVKAINAPDTKEKFSSQGVDPISNTPEEFAVYIKAELVRWTKVIKDTGARIE